MVFFKGSGSPKGFPSFQVTDGWELSPSLLQGSWTGSEGKMFLQITQTRFHLNHCGVKAQPLHPKCLLSLLSLLQDKSQQEKSTRMQSQCCQQRP